MIQPKFINAAVLVALVAGSALAGCSSNAGFGAPPPMQSAPQAGASNAPLMTPGPGDTAEPSPTPDTPLIVDSSSARLAYDASAADPVKAPRLVEVSFALNNPGASPMPVPNVSIAADANPAVSVPLALQALPNQDTKESIVAIAAPKEPSKTKQLALTFGSGGKSPVLAQTTTDFPANSDLSMTPLDAKAAAGGLTVNDIAVTAIVAPGTGLHYDVTFSLTNAGKSKASIAAFVITPPKGDPVTVAVPVNLPARTETAALSFVVPYLGKDAAKAKSLPDGKYAIAATDGKSTLAQGSGPLL